MNFAFFMILNAVLLLRPEELFPEIAGLRLYLIVITACILTTLPQLLEILRPSELVARPITVCVFGLFVAGILSQVMRGQIGLATDFAGDFSKVVLYYLLQVSVLNTIQRLRTFLSWIVVFVALISCLALLQYHGIVDFEALRPLERRANDSSDEDTQIILQLRGTGIYNDPNDLCLILVTGSISALAVATTASGILLRILWALPVSLFGYSIFLTQSRGGLLGFLIASIVAIYSIFGWKKSFLFAIAILPLILLVSGGRQAEMSLGKEDTAHQRFELWYDGFGAMMRNPLTGIGAGEFADEMGLVAHNSFVHAYVEMGLLGGGLFLFAFALSVFGLQRVRQTGNPSLRLLQPFIMAIVVGYAGGAFSISRDYIVPTYMILGLAESYLRLALPSTTLWFRVDIWMLGRLAIVSFSGWIALNILTRLMMASSSV